MSRIEARQAHARTAAQKTHILDPEDTRRLSRAIQGALHGRTARLDAGASKRLSGKFAEFDPKETAAIAALGNPAEARYRALAGNLDPQARKQLKGLLEQGKVSPELMANLGQLSTQQMGPGMDRSAILNQAIAAIYDPTTVKQGAALTCGAATVQTMLAQQDPAEYVGILAGLSSAEGKVELKNGTTMERPANWNKATIPGAANQLMQTSFMNHTAGGYDAANDLRVDGKKGLYSDEVAFLQQSVLGKAVKELEGNSDDVMKQIAKQANGGKGVSVLVEGEGGGHYVQVKSVKDGKLTYVDPRDGQEHTVDAAEFQKQVKAANLESNDKTLTLKKERPTQHKGILGGGCFLVDAIKAVVKAVVSVVKAVVKAIVTVVKAVVVAVIAVVKAVWNLVKEVVKKAWEILKTVAKAIGQFWEKFGAYILMAVQIACLFIPGCQAISLAIAAIQLAQAAVKIGKGIVNGDWKEIVGGVIGGVGALGAKVVGQTLVTVATVAGKVAKIAGGVMNSAEAIRTGNWGGLVSAAAGAVATGAGFVSDAAGKIAEKAAGWANRAANMYNGIKSGDAFAIAAAGADTVAGGAKDITGKNTATDVLGGVATATTVVKTGKDVATGAPVAAAILGGLAGAGAIAGGIRYATWSDEERKNALDSFKNAATDFGNGDYDKAGRDAAKGLGLNPDGLGGDILGKLATAGGAAKDIVSGAGKATGKVNETNGDQVIDANENGGTLRKGVQGFFGLFGANTGNVSDPQPKATHGQKRLQSAAN